jgi:hypothetical protein
MSWTESIAKQLIKKMEVTIGDNKTIVEMVDGNLKEVHYCNNEIIKIIIKKPVCIKTNINIENNLNTS